jgi:hypothetical protein
LVDHCERRRSQRLAGLAHAFESLDCGRLVKCVLIAAQATNMNMDPGQYFAIMAEAFKLALFP